MSFFQPKSFDDAFEENIETKNEDISLLTSEKANVMNGIFK